MNSKQKANEIANKFVTRSVFDMSNEQLKEERVIAKRNALICVDEIIDALKITTGHCELRRLDQQEVQSDFDYWRKVKVEIEALP
jgi:hypothetical protein